MTEVAKIMVKLPQIFQKKLWWNKQYYLVRKYDRNIEARNQDNAGKGSSSQSLREHEKHYPLVWYILPYYRVASSHANLLEQKKIFT